MTFLRNKYIYLWSCILIAAGFALMQILESTVGLVAVMMLFAVIMVLAADKDMAMPVLLFFLPWSPLMKMRPGAISIYSLAIIAVLAILLLQNFRHFTIAHIFPAALLFALTIVIKTVTGDPINAGYILFFACMLLFPLTSSERGKVYDFYTLVIFFSIGIVTAAISAQQLVIFPTISRYIVVIEYNQLTRLSGFYGDPNFYVAHITATLAGCMLLLLNERKRSKKIVLYLLIAVLLYCGFLSVSKSFALILICMIFLWIIEILFKRDRISSKLTMILALLVGGLYVLSSLVFTDLLDMMIERFADTGSISDFTTRRSEIWLNYFRFFEENPIVLLFGKGYTGELVNNRGSHNVLIQSVYQFGLVGSAMLFGWLYQYMREMLHGVSLKSEHVVQLLILLGGSMGPWLGLDLLMFDEFFIIPCFVFMGIKYLYDVSQGDEEDGDLTEEVTQ
jgi:O-antigen ligase